MKISRRDTLRNWWAFLRADREFLYALVVIVFLISNIITLGFGIASIVGERGRLFTQINDLPQRDLAQWQRQVLQLLNDVSLGADDQAIAAAELHKDVAESRVTLLQLNAANYKAQYPDDLYGEMAFSLVRWARVETLLDAWMADPTRESITRQLETALLLLDVTLNNAQTRMTFFNLDLSTQAEEGNQRMFRTAAVLGLESIILVLMVAGTFMNLSERQFQEATAKESIRKFPDQSPFPIMRIDPSYRVLYANPANKPLEHMFGVVDTMVTDPEHRQWLDAAFGENGPYFGEGEIDGMHFSLISSPVAGEDAVNIYGFDVTNLKEAEHNIRRQLSQLNALRTIDAAIATNTDLVTTLNVVLTQIREQQAVDAAAVFITRPEDDRLHSAASQGFRTSGIGYFSLALGESLAGAVGRDRELLVIPDLANSPIPVPSDLTIGEGFRAFTAMPLEAHGKLLGVLELYQRTPFHPDAEWLEFFRTLAGQTAIALDNIHLFEGMRASNIELRQAYDRTLEGWAKALELRDKETEGHSRRVTTLTMLMAREAGIPEEQWEDVHRGAILHDIGKMGVPDEILLKPGKLDDAEFAVMRRHPEYAYDLLSPIPFLHSSMDIPYYHHEKWDGSGYPRKLKGENIPLPARLFAIIDVWDALRSDRPYRAAWDKEKTVAHLKDSSGSHFDPQVVELFIRLVDEGKIE